MIKTVKKKKKLKWQISLYIHHHNLKKSNVYLFLYSQCLAHSRYTKSTGQCKALSEKFKLSLVLLGLRFLTFGKSIGMERGVEPTGFPGLDGHSWQRRRLT